MRAFFSSLYGRISAIFLVLLLVLSVTQLLVSVQSARNFSRESDQYLNRGLAREFAKTFQPVLEKKLDRGAMAGWIHDLMIFNPRVEIYLLDAEGRPLEVLPGLCGPGPFLDWLESSFGLFTRVQATASPRQRAREVRNHHARAYNRLVTKWQRDLGFVGPP